MLVPIVNDILDYDNKIEISAGFTMSDFDGIEVTGETVGFFTTNDPAFVGISTLITDAGGEFLLVDDSGPGTGTSGTDAYIVGDYHVNASAGSDLFILGMGSSGQNSFGLVQNATYNAGQIDLVASDPTADIDILFVSWLPDGVTVDANFGSVSHGSGGDGSAVYTDYFVGIEAFDLTDFDDYFAGGGPVDINWINPGSGDDTLFGVGSVFTVLDYSMNNLRVC